MDEKDLKIEKVKQVKERLENKLSKIRDVVGIGIGKDENDDYCVKVYVREITDNIKRKIPQQVRGVPVEIVESGEVKLL